MAGSSGHPVVISMQKFLVTSMVKMFYIPVLVII